MSKESRIIKIFKKSHRLFVKKRFKRAKFYQKIIRLFYGGEIPCELQVGENVDFVHGALGTVINKNAIIGNNCKIYHNVTIGGQKGGAPIIGDNVLIGAGACLLGPIRIGNNVNIGANAVVVKDVPENTTIIGNPAIIVKQNGEKVNLKL